MLLEKHAILSMNPESDEIFKTTHKCAFSGCYDEDISERRVDRQVVIRSISILSGIDRNASGFVGRIEKLRFSIPGRSFTMICGIVSCLNAFSHYFFGSLVGQPQDSHHQTQAVEVV
ncbi:MAG: hypothetical protein P8X96_22385 [Desulfobacteraceae bacterium]